jgi:hypothetical protein
MVKMRCNHLPRIIKLRKRIQVLTIRNNRMANELKSIQTISQRYNKRGKINILEKIKQIQVEDSTETNYLQIWKLYTDFSVTKRLLDPLVSDSEDCFLASLKSSYKKSTIGHFSTVLKRIIEKITSKPCNIEKPKLRRNNDLEIQTLSDEELKTTLNEMKTKNIHDWIVLLIIVATSCRIGAVSNIKKKHLIR